MKDIIRLADIRDDQDISQEQMSQILHVKRSTYAMWEVGANIIPFAHLYDYAKYFNLSIDYVLGITNDRQNVIYDKLDIKKLGIILKTLRTNKSLSQKDLAKKLGVTQVCITQYELGRNYISTSNIIKYSKLFNISIHDICTYQIKESELEKVK